mgnify:CR=1 FL=1
MKQGDYLKDTRSFGYTLDRDRNATTILLFNDYNESRVTESNSSYNYGERYEDYTYQGNGATISRPEP